MPSGTQSANQKFMAGVKQTRAAANNKSEESGLNALSTTGGDNPKAGGSSLRPIAKGDVNSTSYNPAKGPST
ncbi:uncharacterized protein GGS25DRAFT_520326 [Hypoxylon fragiforme]|uniref:uncharacterized protein n=1 Tax=Hypoxylon fragiforme TaxID=63214 RepID=UPI0020C62543|nr:uncharacterized protein GGS25DRAFT_520326 [Hypoxylon fragiforme]KAI2609525.1 hypothetical protein GGS25DRAFT_520326 [Hypoxylon fragiforme]